MFEDRDIALPEYEKELMDKGGKLQVPFLVDEERGVSMYESDDIIEYLFEYHGGK
jgi:glutathione S-transferase